MCGLYTDSPIDPYYLALDKCNSQNGLVVDYRFDFKILKKTEFITGSGIYNYTCLDEHCPATEPLLREDSVCHTLTNCLNSDYNRLTVNYEAPEDTFNTYYYCISECYDETVSGAALGSPEYTGDYTCVTPCPPSEFEILN